MIMFKYIVPTASLINKIDNQYASPVGKVRIIAHNTVKLINTTNQDHPCKSYNHILTLNVLETDFCTYSSGFK